MEKPPILSDEMIDRLCRIETRVAPDVVVETFIPNPLGRDIAQAQLDADVAYYEPLIQQANEVAREMIKDIESWKYVPVGTEWQASVNNFVDNLVVALKSKYGGQRK
jgi:hypothetical protein